MTVSAPGSAASVPSLTAMLDPAYMQSGFEPLSSPPAPVSGVPTGGAVHGPASDKRPLATYTVKAGDSVFGIAKKLGVTPTALYEANRGTIGAPFQKNGVTYMMIRPGQQLHIPGSSVSAQGSAQPAPRDGGGAGPAAVSAGAATVPSGVLQDQLYQATALITQGTNLLAQFGTTGSQGPSSWGTNTPADALILAYMQNGVTNINPWEM